MLPQPRRSPHVRVATEDDMAAIHGWLLRQDRDGVEGSFLCNWNLTLECQRTGELIVFIDPASQVPVAYQWGALLEPGILEVRADKRGTGIGRVMVEHRLADVRERNEDILFIQCTPSSSVPFWTRMGFRLVEATSDMSGRGDVKFAYRIMPRPLPLAVHGDAVQVEVQWFGPERKWAPDAPVLATSAPAAVRSPAGDIHFAERVHGLGRTAGGDLVVRIAVQGNEIYCDKAKYEEAQALGLQRCRNGFYLDGLRLL